MAANNDERSDAQNVSLCPGYRGREPVRKEADMFGPATVVIGGGNDLVGLLVELLIIVLVIYLIVTLIKRL